MVWTSEFTYLKAGGTWYYLCIIMDLFSRKIISWNISSKP
ncbi:DDE-type integrase/transposase/recombinase, partial [Anaerotignum lactatifermentans]